MYDNVYQEYINNMLGGAFRNQSTFESMQNSNLYNNLQFQNMTTNIELEQLYPDLYKLLYPMVQAACMKNTKPITEETIDDMVRDIYLNFNADDTTAEDIDLTSNSKGNSKINEHQGASNSKYTSKQLTDTKGREIRAKEENRITRPNNFVLNDLIRILLIRELLGRPGSFSPNRPGFPPQRPGPGRPPFRPRDFEFETQDFGIYEDPQIYSNLSGGYNSLRF